MLILDMQPASIVDLGFVNTLDPHYDIPSRRTLMRRLPTKYEETKPHILKVLPQVNYVSLTTDIWTPQATESFVSETMHFIHSWEMKSLLLATIKFSMEHTTEHIADELRRITNQQTGL